MATIGSCLSLWLVAIKWRRFAQDPPGSAMYQYQYSPPPPPYQQIAPPILPKRPPPPINTSDLGGMIGAPVHILYNCRVNCVKCWSDTVYNPEFVVSSDNTQIQHLQLNVCMATGYRNRGMRIPPELLGRTAPFDFTVQLSDLPLDPASWLFSKERLIAIIHPKERNSIVINKPPGAQDGNSSMTMTRVKIGGWRYMVEWILEASPGHTDIGRWGWYKYLDGSLRVWNWQTDKDHPAVCVAWRDPGDFHWYLHEAIAETIDGPGESAAIIIIAGIIAFNDQGRTLTVS
ncbi:hypothetical protein B0H10DRAFT_2052387 [Mycena sp. CBHHK59/15]|nr:hypothetical protein B0H10DRAFT_2052387 [Mycena sp. CBHHK59/15]